MSSQQPDRSDQHLPPEEAARIAQEAREYFEGIAPKRPLKPHRSDYSSDHYSVALPSSEGHPDYSIPELDRLRHLETTYHQKKLVCEASEPTDEYVETEYYKDLNCIDKQHHTTGTGFIRVEKPNGSPVNLTSADTTSVSHSSCGGNPATNEWIPAPDVVISISDKPNRSDV